MVNYLAVKIVGLAWLLMAMLLALLGGTKSARNEKGSGNLIVVTLCLFPVAITFAERNAAGGSGASLLGYPTIHFLGYALVALGVAIHLLGILTLRRQWTSSVALSADPKLVTHGVYRVIRNPIYAGILLALLGFGLTLSNWISLAMLVVPNCLSFGYRIYVEEKFLAEYFGEEYRAYKERSKRIIPFLF